MRYCGRPQTTFRYAAQSEAKNLEDIHRHLNDCCATVKENLQEGHDLLILSGDHSNAAGLVSGLKDAYPDKRVGLIWIDAHGDLHTPWTSPSGNVHGMPVGALMGLDEEDQKLREVPDLTANMWSDIRQLGDHRIEPKINDTDVVFIGIRDLEQPEWNLLDRRNIRYYRPEQFDELGMKRVISETLEHLQDCDLLYISFDVDSMDPCVSWGTGTPVPGGLTVVQAKQLLRAFSQEEKTKVVEFTEVNPLLDRENKMATTVVELLRAVLRG